MKIVVTRCVGAASPPEPIHRRIAWRNEKAVGTWAGILDQGQDDLIVIRIDRLSHSWEEPPEMTMRDVVAVRVFLTNLDFALATDRVIALIQQH